MSTKLNVGEIIEARAAHATSPSHAAEAARPVYFPIALVAVLAAVPALQYFDGYNYLLHMMLFALMYVAMASSWNILGGYTGYISLGHNVFFCIGGYFSGMILAYTGISTLVTAPLAGLVASLVGFGIGFITLRMRGPTFIISSIALLMVVRILFDNWEFVGGVGGVTLPQLDIGVQWSKLPYYYAMLVIAVAAVYCSYRIKHSKFGLQLRAISQDEVKAESAGINTRFCKMLAFAISAFFVGMAGAVWGEYLTYIRPNIFLIILIAANMVLMCILGGKGTVAGPVIGAVLLIFFNEFFVYTLGSSAINIFGTGLVMILALLYFPNGIVGTLAQKKKLQRFLNWD